MCVHEHNHLSLLAEVAPEGCTLTPTVPVPPRFPGEVPSRDIFVAIALCGLQSVMRGIFRVTAWPKYSYAQATG